MDQELVLLRMDKDDLEECIDVFIDTFSKEPWNDVYDSRDEVTTFFINHMNSSYFLGYVLKLNNRIIGLSVGFKKPWIKGMEYYIDELCIDYDYQGEGYGSEFMRLIEEDIKEEDLEAIFLNTKQGSPSAEFYKENGFTELDELVILDKII